MSASRTLPGPIARSVSPSSTTSPGDVPQSRMPMPVNVSALSIPARDSSCTTIVLSAVRLSALAFLARLGANWQLKNISSLAIVSL